MLRNDSRLQCARMSHIGHVLFPKEALIQGLRWSDGQEKIRDAIETRPFGRKIDVIIFVAVSYRIIGDDAAHITHHVYTILNKQIGTAVPTGQMEVLAREEFLAGEAD